jgi:hypothetical protein
MSLSYGAKLDRVKARKEVVSLAKREFLEEFRNAFPEGTHVWWSRGGHRQQGVVVSHNPYSDNMAVRNLKTGNIVRIGSYDLTEGPAS